MMLGLSHKDMYCIVTGTNNDWDNDQLRGYPTISIVRNQHGGVLFPFAINTYY